MLSRKKRFLALAAAVLLMLYLGTAGAATRYRTLRVGSRGQSVTRVQQALIELGYELEEADGHYGAKTRDAVRAFQMDSNLKADGIAGKATQEALFAALEAQATPTPDPHATAAVTPVPEPTTIPYVVVTARPAGLEQETAAPPEEETPPEETAVPEEAVSPTPAPTQAASLFGGSYRLMRSGSRGTRVKALQEALTALGYDCGEADGRFGVSTRRAVIAFQRDHGLSADGQAGKKTLKAIEEAWAQLGSAPQEDAP